MRIATAMATVEEQNVATNSKLDELVKQMQSLTGWMKSVNDTTADLAKNTDLLKLHAEDTASRISNLESRSGPATPPTVVVRTANDNQPHGPRDADVARGQDVGGNRPPDPPPKHGTSRSASLLFDRESDPEGF